MSVCISSLLSINCWYSTPKSILQFFWAFSLFYSPKVFFLSNVSIEVVSFDWGRDELSNKKRSTGVIFREKNLIKMETNVRQLLENMTWFLRSFMIFSKKLDEILNSRGFHIAGTFREANFFRDTPYAYAKTSWYLSFIPLLPVTPIVAILANTPRMFLASLHSHFRKKKRNFAIPLVYHLIIRHSIIRHFCLPTCLFFLSLLRIFFS